MQAVMIHPWILEERSRMDLDRRDEVWEGVLHMAPQPTSSHQGLGSDLLEILAPIVRKRGWLVRYEMGFHAGEKNYRVPDLTIVSSADVSDRGTENHAEMVVEILSPHDESRAKLPFYAKHGVSEVWLIEPKTRVVEIFTLRDGVYVSVAPDGDGTLSSPLLAIELATVDGPKLRVTDQLI